ncbi:MAG TPA: DUF5677 domain-containing protein [Bacteroidia bacterium]|nr:DUF5677 domain-containing protein [Bacteroidia bacterium]
MQSGSNLNIEMSDSSPVTFADFTNHELKNHLASSETLKEQITFFITFFDIQQGLFRNHFTGMLDLYYTVQQHERVALQAYVKIIHLAYNTHNLIVNGNYGTANILLRQIFEFLLIGKYIMTTSDQSIANKWLDGSQLDVYDKIIKRLKSPNKKTFHDFWIVLCKLNHATTHSHQIGLTFKLNKIQILGSYSILLLLLKCNYHLLNSHFINRKLKYYSDHLCGCSNENSKLRIGARTVKKSISGRLSPDGRSLIKHYESRWVF